MSLKCVDPKLLARINSLGIYNQADDEEVLMYIHKHWVVTWKLFGKLIFIVIAAVPIPFWWEYVGPDWKYVILLGVIFLMHAYFISIFAKWFDYYMDVIVVTNYRLIDVNQDGFFNRKVSDIPLFKIQDVSGNSEGFIAAWLGYGNLSVDIAGSGKVGLNMIPDPFKVVHEIQRIQMCHMKDNYADSSDSSVGPLVSM